MPLTDYRDLSALSAGGKTGVLRSSPDVAAGVPPAVEGGILPPGKTARIGNSPTNIPQYSPRARFFPPGWKPRLHGRPEARRYGVRSFRR
jgi:hypothetical protein